jgi:hypothetical protein
LAGLAGWLPALRINSPLFHYRNTWNLAFSLGFPSGHPAGANQRKPLLRLRALNTRMAD